MIKKDITFIYSDSAEKSFMNLLEKEAKKRGYKTKLTKDKFSKCEIGIYCQHVNFPEYSKFSVIMLHDIIQQYSNWPDIWYKEPWNKYDIGILPSYQWVNNWKKSSQYKYSRPKKGMFLVGWPKADKMASINKNEYRKSFYHKYNLDIRKKTVLYAPAWENDNKQDEFVKAVLDLDVNVIIKQWNADPNLYPNQVKNVKEMAKLHKNNKRICILPPKTNIFDAILAADILVSEESSTMGEATMLGIPTVSVSDWLIPDVTPSRYPKCDYDFAIKTKKSELNKCISNIIMNYDIFKEKSMEYSKNNFPNLGNSCKMIMDIIDDSISNKNIRYEQLHANKTKKIPIKKNIKRICYQIYIKMAYKWKYKSILFGIIWNTAKKVKSAFRKDTK